MSERTEKKEKKEKKTKPKCTVCGKTLVAIGNSRSNGKTHNDWADRKMHKKCWVKTPHPVISDEELERAFEDSMLEHRIEIDRTIKKLEKKGVYVPESFASEVLAGVYDIEEWAETAELL